MAKKAKTTKGVFQPGIPLEELEKKQVAIPVSTPERKSIRYRCARISNKNWEDDGLKEQIEKQLEEDMSWDNFTVIWDISKEPPHKVVKL